jgi:hypothetical protein
MHSAVPIGGHELGEATLRQAEALDMLHGAREEEVPLHAPEKECPEGLKLVVHRLLGPGILLELAFIEK